MVAAGTASAAAVAPTGCTTDAISRPAPERASSDPIFSVSPDRIDPWIELDSDAFRANLRLLRDYTEKPIVAVVKCNGYGLDHRVVGRLLDQAPEVATFAVVTAEEAIQLRDAGVTKPILLMGDFTPTTGPELAHRDITLAVYTQDTLARLGPLAQETGRPVKIHPYIDTGFHRLGMDVREARPWIETLDASSSVQITGTMTELTQDMEFDKEQIRLFRAFADAASSAGIQLGPLHAAASHGIVNHPEGWFDMIRPGNLLYGIPAQAADDEAAAGARVVFSLKTRVIRVVELPKGESVGYSRGFAPGRDTDVAIIKCGRTDGYVYRETKGEAVARINGRTYPLVSDINSSHCYADLGKDHGVERLDEVTLIGPEPGLRPQDLARISGRSRYESFNLNPRVPKVVV